MKKLLFIFGTRPEAIKLAPIILECNRYSKFFKVQICITEQHKEMLEQVMTFFSLNPDYSLNLMRNNQTLFDVTTRGLKLLEEVIDKAQPDFIIVQGDTTTAFIGALAAFYKKIKVAHVEAGLRSFNKYSPFPEEVNRKLISNLTDYHFAPTKKAAENLQKEGIQSNIIITGNTVIDALLIAVNKVKNSQHYIKYFSFLNLKKKIILITAHRRESFGKPFKDICKAIAKLASKYPNLQFVYPVHLNPNVRQVVKEELSHFNNIFLIEPLDYAYFVWLLNKSYIVITDSGGVQEEAPTLGKPILVIRDITEREEGISEGTAKLVGTKTNKIIEAVSNLLEDKNLYKKMSNTVNPYGIGNSAKQIVDILIRTIK